MKAAIFSTKSYEIPFFKSASQGFGLELTYLEPRLTLETAPLAEGFPTVCAFVNDQLSAPVLKCLYQGGTRLIALRSAGFNHVDLAAANELGLTVLRVPSYSPYAIAEYTIGLILDLNRKIHRAYHRVREANFSLEGLLGFDLHGKTVGIIGTGKIGHLVAKILMGFGCEVLAYDPYPSDEMTRMGVRYVPLGELFRHSEIISLHCPLTPQTHHLINAESISLMKQGVMLINTSRGAVVDTQAVIQGLKTGKIGYVGMDVYEEEGDLFFKDLSDVVIQDDVFARLLTFPNVLITGHQAFFTREAMEAIAHTTLRNISDFAHDRVNEENLVTAVKVTR